MKKSISSSALSDRSPVSLSPSMTPPSSRPRTATTMHATQSTATHYYSPPDLSSTSTEAVAEAFVRTTIPNIAVCTELYGFPNEVLQKDRGVVNQYVGCLMQPEEVVTTDEEVHPIAPSSLSRMISADPERVARLFLIERKRQKHRRRWSVA